MCWYQYTTEVCVCLCNHLSELMALVVPSTSLPPPLDSLLNPLPIHFLAIPSPPSPLLYFLPSPPLPFHPLSSPPLPLTPLPQLSSPPFPSPPLTSTPLPSLSLPSPYLPSPPLPSPPLPSPPLSSPLCSWSTNSLHCLHRRLLPVSGCGGECTGQH